MGDLGGVSCISRCSGKENEKRTKAKTKFAF